MSEFWKITSVILLSVILCLTVGKTEKDIATILGMVVCCVTAGAAVKILEPVLDFLWELQQLCDLPEGVIGPLLKAVGVALVAEISASVCADAGNASLGKTLQMLGGAVVLSLSVPMLRSLMTIIKELISGL